MSDNAACHSSCYDSSWITILQFRNESGTVKWLKYSWKAMNEYLNIIITAARHSAGDKLPMNERVPQMREYTCIHSSHVGMQRPKISSRTNVYANQPAAEWFRYSMPWLSIIEPIKMPTKWHATVTRRRIRLAYKSLSVRAKIHGENMQMTQKTSKLLTLHLLHPLRACVERAAGPELSAFMNFQPNAHLRPELHK